MATIQKFIRSKGIVYRVLIRKSGTKPISKTFSSKKLALQFAESINSNREENSIVAMVTPEMGLLEDPTMPAMYDATAEKRNPNISITIESSMASPTLCMTSRYRKKTGSRRANNARHTYLMGKSCSSLGISELLAKLEYAEILERTPSKRGFVSLMRDQIPPTTMAPTPKYRIFVFHIVHAVSCTFPSHPFIAE